MLKKILGGFFGSKDQSEELEKLKRSFAFKETELNSQINILKSDTEKIRTTLEQLEASNHDLAEKNKKLSEIASRPVESSSEKEDSFIQEIQLLKNDMVRYKTSFEKAEAKNKELQIRLEQSISPPTELLEEVAHLKKKVEEYEAKIVKIEFESSQIKHNADEEIQKYKDKEKELNRQVKQLREELKIFNDLKKENLFKQDEKPAVVIEKKPGKKRILVVDDSLIMRNLQKNILEPAGFEIFFAKNGLEGKENVSKYDPDLVITDIEMPEMNGIELTKWIKGSYNSNIPVVIISSKLSGFSKHNPEEAGANTIITKDEFEQKVFLKTIESLL